MAMLRPGVRPAVIWACAAESATVAMRFVSRGCIVVWLWGEATAGAVASRTQLVAVGMPSTRRRPHAKGRARRNKLGKEVKLVVSEVLMMRRAVVFDTTGPSA